MLKHQLLQSNRHQDRLLQSNRHQDNDDDDDNMAKKILVYTPVVLLLLGLLARNSENDKANILVFVAILMFSLFEFVPVGKSPVSMVSVIRNGHISPISTFVCVTSFVVAILTVIHIIVPVDISTLYVDILTFSVMIVPMVFLIGYVKT